MSGRTLLGVWAHPDDEAYLSAGLMASYRQRGDRVVVVTATFGEHGTSDPEEWPPARLARHRERELKASLAALDVHELHILGYPDGGCAQYEGMPVIATYIEALDPDVIVTFGPDGMTGHPDHRAVHQWVTDAWRLTPTAADLWYATVSHGWHQEYGWINDQINLWVDQPEPPRASLDEMAHIIELDDDLLRRKAVALEAHASQTTGLRELLGEDAFRDWWRTEFFRRCELTGVDRHPSRTAVGF